MPVNPTKKAWSPSPKGNLFNKQRVWNIPRNELLTDVENIVNNANQKTQPIVNNTTVNNAFNFHNSSSSYSSYSNEYVSNYYSQNSSSSSINYNITYYFAYPPRNIDNLDKSTWNLPKDVDNQRDFKTPVGNSINISDSLDKGYFNRLLFNPLSAGKIGLIRSASSLSNFSSEFRHQETLAYEQRMLYEEKEIDILKPLYSGVLVAPAKMRGMGGDSGLLFGLNTISALAQLYRVSASFSFMEATNILPIKHQDIPIKDEIIPLNFNGEIFEDIFDTPLWEKLGFSSEDAFKNSSIEDIIKQFGKKQYKDQPNPDPKNFDTYKSDNLIKDISPFDTEFEFLLYCFSSLFFRGGYHRLPAKVPETLLNYPSVADISTGNKSNKEKKYIIIDDNLEFQEWFVKNFDAIVGEFPLSFKYTTQDNNGKNKVEEICLPNLSEAMVELMGILMGCAQDSHATLGIAIKTIIETVKTSNLALTAVDIAQANADFLGYKGKQISRKVMVPFNSEATSIEEFMQNKEMTITTWDNIDEVSLIEYLKRLLVSAGIIQAVYTYPRDHKFGENIQIKEAEKQAKTAGDWLELLDKYGKDTPNSLYPKSKLIPRTPPTNPTNPPNQPPIK